MQSSIKKWLKSLRQMKKEEKAHESSISEALNVQKRKVLIAEDKLKRCVDAMVANIGPELGIEACTAQHARVQAAKSKEERLAEKLRILEAEICVCCNCQQSDLNHDLPPILEHDEQSCHYGKQKSQAEMEEKVLTFFVASNKEQNVSFDRLQSNIKKVKSVRSSLERQNTAVFLAEETLNKRFNHLVKNIGHDLALYACATLQVKLESALTKEQSLTEDLMALETEIYQDMQIVQSGFASVSLKSSIPGAEEYPISLMNDLIAERSSCPMPSVVVDDDDNKQKVITLDNFLKNTKWTWYSNSVKERRLTAISTPFN